MDLCLDNAFRHTTLQMTVALPQGASLSHAFQCMCGSHHVDTSKLDCGLHRIVVKFLSS